MGSSTFAASARLAVAAIGHVEPVARRDLRLLVRRGLHALEVGIDRLSELAFQVVGEPEVVPHVEVQRARPASDAARLDFVRFAADELRAFRQIGDRLVEIAHADVAVSAEPVEARVLGIEIDALAEGVDSVVITMEVAEPSAEPDDVVGLLRIGRVLRLGLLQVLLELRSLLGSDERIAVQGLPVEGGRFRFLLRAHRARKGHRQDHHCGCQLERFLHLTPRREF